MQKFSAQGSGCNQVALGPALPIRVGEQQRPPGLRHMPGDAVGEHAQG